MKTLVIGDPHFKNKKEADGKLFADAIISIVKKHNPTFVVILGDILNDHGIVHVLAHNVFERLLDEIYKLTQVYCLIGNHDYINNQQFLTTNHIFGPFKKWPNVTIVDKPISMSMEVNGEEKTFVFVPYVPPGRFVEALNKLTSEGHNWEFADCIFAHQEFKGCKKGSKLSIAGDEWDEAYPLVISGHMHEAHTVADNIIYIGTPVQQSFGESSNKRVWLIDWDSVKSGENENEENNNFQVTKINLGLKRKKVLTMTIEELNKKMIDGEKKFMSLIENAYVRIKISGTSAELAVFRSSSTYQKLTEKGVLFSHKRIKKNPVKEGEPIEIATIEEENEDGKEKVDSKKSVKENISYAKVFKKLVMEKDDATQNEYKFLFES